MRDFEHSTTSEFVSTYEAVIDIFSGLIQEMRELSKKKPDATLSKGKVRILNRALSDAQSILMDEPEGKYLDLLSDEELPQNSDAVLVMVQYEKALAAFYSRYTTRRDNLRQWITPGNIQTWTEEEEERARRFREEHGYELDDYDHN